MRKLLATLFIATLAFAGLQAQNSKVMSTINYLRYFQEEGKMINLMKARNNIEEAAKHEKTMADGKTWYYKGKVYQTIAEVPEMADTMKMHPLYTALKSFKKAVSLEDNRFRGSEKDDAYLQIDYVGMKIFEEAYEDFENANFADAYEKFLKSRDVIIFMEESGRESLNQNKENALTNASLAARNGDMIEEEMATYRMRLAEGEDNPLIYKAMAERYLQKEDVEKAKEIVAEGLEKYPNNIDLMIEDLNFYLKEDKLEQAIDKLEMAAKLDSTNPELLFVLGTAFDKIGDPEGAENSYLDALEVRPDHYKSIFNLGALYFNQAVKVNEEMNELSYKQQEKYEELEVKRNELFKKAKPYFEKALEINPEETSIERELRRINSALSN